MEAIPSIHATRGREVETEHFRRRDFPIFCYAYIAGRTIMISITIYFLIRDVLAELKYPYHWLGFLTIHMILECSVTYSDPLWNSECIKAAKIHIHWIFAVSALVSGTVYFCCRKITLFDVPSYNSTGITTIPNDIKPGGTWHCAYSYWLLCSIFAATFVAVFITGVIFFANVRSPPVYIYRFHKCIGALVTYSMIILLACNVFNWLSAPMNWIIFLLTILAFVVMPVKIFANIGR